jgi:hypothetical protein
VGDLHEEGPAAAEEEDAFRVDAAHHCVVREREPVNYFRA